MRNLRSDAHKRLASVSTTSFVAWLGKLASVWDIYTQNMGNDCCCRLSRAMLAERLSQPPGTIQKYVHRLRKKGVLISDSGSRKDYVTCRYRDKTKATILVPQELIEEVENAAGWGGRRKGAGRKNKSSVHLSKAPQTQKINQVSTLAESVDVSSLIQNKSSVHPCDPLRLLAITQKNKSSVHLSNTSFNPTPLKGCRAIIEKVPLKGNLLHARTRASSPAIKNLSIKCIEKSNCELTRGFIFSKEKKNANTPTSCAPTESISITEEVTPNGIKFGGRFRDSTWLYEGVPPYPTARLVPPISIPKPPRIDPAWPEDTQLAFLAQVWTATIEHFANAPCWIFRTRRQGRGKKKKLVNGIDKHRPELLAAIALCLEHKIQPGPWIAFSFDEWTNMMSKADRAKVAPTPSKKSRARRRRKSKSASAPPFKWVFSESRIVARTGWYGHVLERELYCGMIRFTAKHRLLLRRHTAMRFALMALSSPTRDEVDKIVDKFLPERYELLVRQCNEETAREQDRLNRKARDGEWLW